jgi:PST family polysaccharide transporter
MSSSQRQILRATSIVGLASMLNIAIGLARTKVAALLLGPAGIGQIGLFLNLIQFAATLGAVGLGTSAVRQIAEARGRDDGAGIAAAQRALVWTSLALAAVSGLLFWALHDPIMHHMAINRVFSKSFGWLAAAVSLTILSGVPVALLIGHRRIGDQAIVQIVGALVGTIIGVGILFIWGEDGIIGYIVVAPAAMLLSGMFVVRRLPRTGRGENYGRVLAESRAMVSLGLPLMIGAISVTGGMLTLRSMLQDRLGPVQLGQFTAAWTLCVTYVGFVMQAMATDYYPRLSSTIHDRTEACRLVNEQIGAMLLIGLPVIVGMQASAPWLVRLLYSSQFSGALEVIRWQIVGDIFKIVSAPLAYVILASRRGRLYWFVETSAIVTLVVISSMILPMLGLKATGVGYLSSAILYFPLVYIIARKLIGFSLDKGALRLIVASVTAVSFVGVASAWCAMAGLIVGVPLAAIAGVHAVRTLNLVDALPVALKRFAPNLLTGRTDRTVS